MKFLSIINVPRKCLLWNILCVTLTIQAQGTQKFSVILQSMKKSLTFTLIIVPCYKYNEINTEF